ncbi:hypothetical protein Nepgr_017933 [Nepenthes gracilis]|uniref:DUF4408 domain-containing protein n=1 Tax=Nepenthes gracilis TaxID=150966 RepID=A0AAD3XSL7_NEPGR|nr:hypothetical protein Nepgr_017933 [Nepenthes gracilis]
MADGQFKVGKLMTAAAGMIIVLLVNSWDLVASNAPDLWILIRRLLSPPLIYFILNFIIISILLSSNFTAFINLTINRLTNTRSSSSSRQSPQVEKDQIRCHFLDKEGEEEDDCFIVDNTNNQLLETGSFESLSLRLEHSEALTRPRVMAAAEPPTEGRRKEGGQGEEEERDTLDAIWREIMEVEEKAATRQLRKSDTWGAAQPRVMEPDDRRELKKSETSKEGGRGRGSREAAVLSPDELKRRADAFISKTRADIWLQRQESDQRFMEMINRGL